MSGEAGPAGSTPERRVAGWIGKAVRVEGKVVSTEDLVIDGNVEGTIELGNHNLTIGLGADVKANLTAKAIVINGSVKGDILATDRIDLRATGSVEGNVTTPCFAMADGATVNGKVESGQKFTQGTSQRP